MIRRVAAGLLFAALLAGGLRPSLLRLLLPPHRPPEAPAPEGAVDRRPLRFTNDPTPPEVAQFFEELRAHTKPGEKVGLLMSPPNEGFGYTYWRASYALTGRPMLLPVSLVYPHDADVIALWEAGWGSPNYELAWLGERNGALLRRKK